MHHISHEARLYRRERLVYEGRDGTRELDIPLEEIGAYGLFGRDVLLSRGAAMYRWSPNEQSSKLFTGPKEVRFGSVAGDDTTGLVAFSVREQLYVAKTRGATAMHRMWQSDELLSSVAVAPAAPLVAASAGCRIVIFNLASTTPIFSFQAPARVRALSFSPMGYGVACLTEDCEVVVWSLVLGCESSRTGAPAGCVDLLLHDVEPDDVTALDFAGREVTVDGIRPAARGLCAGHGFL